MTEAVESSYIESARCFRDPKIFCVSPLQYPTMHSGLFLCSYLQIQMVLAQRNNWCLHVSCL